MELLRVRKRCWAPFLPSQVQPGFTEFGLLSLKLSRETFAQGGDLEIRLVRRRRRVTWQRRPPCEDFLAEVT